MNVIQTGVGVLIVRQHCILLGHRCIRARDTGGIYEPDSWCLPGGKQEFNETVIACAIREVKEETDLEVSDLTVFGAADDISSDRHFVTLHVIAGGCQGEPKVMEPTKQDQWKWFALDHLPAHLYSPSAKLINAYRQRIQHADGKIMPFAKEGKIQ